MGLVFLALFIIIIKRFCFLNSYSYLCSMWYYKEEVIDSLDKIPKGVIGFIYLLTNKKTNKQYIGKKLLFSERKKKLTKKEISELENKRLKKWKLVKSESDWLIYNSSSKEIQEEIRQGEEFYREILHFAFSKHQLTYLETKEQFLRNVLESDNFYNLNILSKFFKGNI